MFCQLYDACIQKEKLLTDAEKMTCFETIMKTENGKEQVQRAAVSGLYEDVVAELNEFMIDLELFSNIT